MSLFMLGLVGVAAVATSYVVDAVTTWSGPASTWPTWAAVIGGGLAAIFAPGLISVVGMGAALGAVVRGVSVGSMQFPSGWGLDERFKGMFSAPATPPKQP